MAQHNPYAPSAASLKARDKTAHGGGSQVWRDGKWIVMSLGGSLPLRCVKCNAPADQPTKQRHLYWHHWAIYLLIFVQIIIYLIVALVTRKVVLVEPGLCEDHKRRRRNAILAGWLGLVLAFVVPIALTRVLPDFTGLWIALCVAMGFGFPIYGIVASRILYAKKIDHAEARLGGAGEEFLDSLPVRQITRRQ